MEAGFDSHSIQCDHNALALNYNYFRDYDPQTGRYVESDAIGLRGGINTYAYAKSDPSESIDPLGLWDPAAHHDIYDKAFPGLDPMLLQRINSASDWVDYLYQFQQFSYMHAMRAPDQTIDEAKRLGCAYVKGQLAAFNQLKNGPFIGEAYGFLGNALHAISDSTSPAHEGWQAWRLWGSADWQFHGDSAASLETMKALDAGRLKLTLDRIHAAMAGQDCGCFGF